MAKYATTYFTVAAAIFSAFHLSAPVGCAAFVPACVSRCDTAVQHHGPLIVDDNVRSPQQALFDTKPSSEKPVMVTRQRLLQGFLQGVGAAASIAVATGSSAEPASAAGDVWSGGLPKGASQFNNCIRLRRDLKRVTARVAENADELDKKEWDSIGQFLRSVYSTAENDMRAVAAGIVNADNKSRALEDISQLKKYSQAADVSVSKQDAKGFVAIGEKMSSITDDFFNALIDVPDEI